MPNQDDPRMNLAEKSILKTGLADDTKGAWNNVGNLAEMADLLSPSEAIKMILVKEVQHYAQYAEEQLGEPIRSYVIENSDPEKVKLFDGLVDRANAVRAEALADLESGSTAASTYIEQLSDLHRQALHLIKGE